MPPVDKPMAFCFNVVMTELCEVLYLVTQNKSQSFNRWRRQLTPRPAPP